MQIEFDLAQNYSYKSPLMYPGGKSRVCKKIRSYIPTDLTTLVSPFMGGGSIELNCACNNIKVIASDNFEPLVNFWQYFISDANKVIDIVLKLFPLSYEETVYYYKNELKPNQKNFYGNIYSDLERAAIFLLMNKQSFRGLALSRTPQKKYLEASANIEMFEKLRTWYNPNINVHNNDYRTTLDQYNGHFMYFDPPYVEKEDYYGSKSINNHFDHHEFKDRISCLDNRWVLSYLKHDLIIGLYQDFNIIEYQQPVTMGKRIKDKEKARVNTELFIMNF